MERIRVVVDPEIPTDLERHMWTRMTVRMTGGRSASIGPRPVPGHPANPLTLEALREKFAECAALVLPADRVDIGGPDRRVARHLPRSAEPDRDPRSRPLTAAARLSRAASGRGGGSHRSDAAKSPALITSSTAFTPHPCGEPNAAESSTEAALLATWQITAGITLADRSVTSPR